MKNKQKAKFNIYKYWLKHKQGQVKDGDDWEDFNCMKKFREIFFNCPEDKLDQKNILLNQIFTDDDINITCVPISYQGAINIFTQDLDELEGELEELNYDIDVDKLYRKSEVLVENIIARLPPSPQSIKFDPKRYSNYTDTFTRVHPIAERQTEGRIYSYKFINPVVPENNFNKKNSNGEYVLGSWRESLKRMTDPVAFAAWVWSIYQPDCKDRQFLYLYGDGNSGKSTLASKIQSNFGKSFVSASKSNDFSQSSSFSLEGLIGKRLILLNELSENTDLTKYPIIKQITGGDMVKIDRKFLGSISMRLDARIFVVSNYVLNITNEEHSRSRVLYIKIKKSDKIENSLQWEQSLDDCYDEFLKFCKFAYSKTYINNIIYSSESEKLKDEVLNIVYEDILKDFKQIFEVTNDEKDYIKTYDFWRMLESMQNHKQFSNVEKAKLKKAIFDLHKLSDFNNSQGGKIQIGEERIYVYRGVKFNSDEWVAQPAFGGKINIEKIFEPPIFTEENYSYSILS
jgi:hypothetical protein